MSSKTCLTAILACCFAFLASSASAWSLHDAVELISFEERHCQVLTAGDDDQSAADDEASYEEEPDCE